MRGGTLWSYLLLVVICGAFIPNSVVNSLSFPLSTNFYNTMTDNPIDSLLPNTQQIDARNSVSTFSEVTQVSTPDLEPTFEQEGTLDARNVTHSATYSSDWQSLQTDEDKNASLDLLLDRSHNWIGQRVDMQIKDLQRLYLENGTFNDGINGTNVDGVGNAHPFGWNEQVYDGGTSAQTQRTSYINTSGYVIVENEGRYDAGWPPTYYHRRYTYARWSQNVSLQPFTLQFYLRFQFLYHHGPLGGYSNRFMLTVWFDSDRVFEEDVTNLESRDEWFDTGLIGINCTTLPTTFNFSIGLRVRSSVSVNPYDFSCDGDWANARYITLFLDNVSLVGRYKSNPSEVALKAHLPDNVSTDINDDGSGSGSGSVVHEYWVNEPLNVTFSSNTSISFDCLATLYVLNIRNSTWEMQVDSEGVKFEVAAGQSVNLTLWVIVTYPGSYQNYRFNVTFPVDWENVTVFDSFPSDVTSECTIGLGYLEVNGSIAEQYGWWQVKFQAPNYARSLTTQVYDSTFSMWQNQTSFSCINKTRVIGSIGSSNVIPNPLTEISTTWLLPNQTTWSQAVSSGGSDGRFNSSSRWFGQTNTSAGVWTVLVAWKNDSEVAFDTAEFILFHKARLTPVYSIIDTTPETTFVTGMVEYMDDDNNATILDGTASVVANWSTTIVNFAPNSVQNRWEGDFNMSMVNPGSHIIWVNATHPYFDDTFCSFTIILEGVLTHLEILEPPPPAINVKQSVEIKVCYEDNEGEGILDADVIVDSTDPSSGIAWDPATPVSGEPGNYTIEITPIVEGEYRVILKAAKEFYLPATTWFFLSVSGLAAKLTVQGNKSVQIFAGETYVVKLRYENATHGLPGAKVNVSIMQESGLDYSVIQDMGNGNYNITFTPTIIESFTIIFTAKLPGYVQNSTYFFLYSIPHKTTSHLRTPLPPQVIVNHSIELTVWYNYSNTEGVVGANIRFTGLEPEEIEFTSHLNGNYTVVLTPMLTGEYSITLRLSREGYEESVLSFALKVVCIPIEIRWKSTEFLHCLQGTTLTFSVNLFEQGTDNAVKGITIHYVIKQLGITGIMTDLRNGTYTATIQIASTVPPATYELQVTVSETRYYATAESDIQLIVDLNLLILTTVVVIIVLVLISGYISKRQLNKRRAASQTKMLAARQEFEDARNIVAALVMYKESGLPAFSTTARHDIRGELVAGFISAIRHFRREVITGEQDKPFELTPISDIVFICPTRSMLCVLITLMPPSQRLLGKLVEFSHIIDKEYDSLLLERDGTLIEHIIPMTLAEVVEKTFSMRLLAPHVNCFDHSVPRKFRDLEHACTTLFPQGKDINLIELSRYLQRQGKREKFSYYIILKAIQAGYLVALPRNHSSGVHSEAITLLDLVDETGLEDNIESEGRASPDT